jgi:dTDP-glucose 4,6-dehydratase
MCLLIAYYRELGEKMRLLVTGGAGFIGSNFVRRTLATRSDVQISVLDSLTYAGRLSNLAGLEGRYEFYLGDIKDAEIVDSLVSKTDVVVHFAAESHNDNSLKSPRPFIDTNVIGTFELIQSCVKHDVRFHHVSTDEVFGDLALEGIDKFTRATPYNPSSPYSASKASSDHLVRAWTRSFGLKATISNCSNNFGPYQHEEKLIPRMIGLIASGSKPELYGNGANIRDWIHVDDHNDGVWAVIEKGVVGQTYLLGADNQRSNLEVVKALLGIMGKPEDFIAFIGDRSGHDLRYAIDASDTEAELGWAPKHGNFEEKLAETVDFYTQS